MKLDQWMKNQAEAQVNAERETKHKMVLDFSLFQEAMDAQDGFVDTDMTIAEIESAFCMGSLTSELLLLAYLKKIQDHQEYNAVLALNPQALEDARRMDDLRAKGLSLGALHGIPILIKDNIGTKAPLQTTAGALVLKEARRDEDAELVRRLKAKGAIILGKTNLSEWANFMSDPSVNGFSSLGGYTHNAWGDFDVSGSSSGSASAMALKLAAACLGSETAGSIVSPASQNGVVGFKPAWGRVSNEGVIPIAASMDVVGPIAGCVKDAAYVYSAMQDEFKVEEAAWSKHALRGKRVGVVVGHVDPEDVREDSARILAEVKTVLREAGAEIIEVEIPKEEADIEILDVLKNELKPGIKAYLDSLGDGAPVRTLAEIIAFNEEDRVNRAPYGQAWLQRSNAVSISQEEEKSLVDAKRAAAKAVIERALEGLDVLVSLATELTSLYSMAGTPALTIPAGRRDTGEPLGATFLADEGEASLLFALGYAFEQNRR